ncbi:WD40 repeat domain-containing protein [Deinococcus cellulosilyticus]|uniref:Uncharacterized protein n=1 Tax=Deinococcus cellulosilyticus (strain DSM 18568 / NBRC 106333 / KACC 11606 / 5516J-15) TaxID=1223518 RepID=A0A511MZM6_DEIC1|nr:WD40 repeat domain-containing protein [Deinococcus cellulosilyticus]GEM45698.1 hypothetical protein DC3_13330 [Deinococcus cellulosilyticus NBRC 106333 = KACC 11606]
MKQAHLAGWITLMMAWGTTCAQEELFETKVFGSSDLSSLALGAEQQVLAVAGRRGIRLWDLVQSRPAGILPSGQVTALALSPDGKHAAAALFNQDLQLWNLSTLKLQSSLQGHTDWVYSLTFSPDSKWLASGSFDQSIRIWNVQDGGATLTLKGHRNWVHAVQFSPEGGRLASGSEDQTARVWDLKTGTTLQVLTGHTGFVSAAAFDASGKQLITGSGDRTARIWDLNTAQNTLTLRGHTDAVTGVAFDPQGAWVATASLDRTVKVWNSTTGALLHTFSIEAEIHLLQASKDGTLLLIGTGQQNLQMWDVQSGQLKTTLQPKF